MSVEVSGAHPGLERSAPRAESRGRLTYPLLAIAAAQTVLVFLPNRFNVPWAIKISGWEFFPTDWLVPLLLLSAWLLQPRSVIPKVGKGPFLFPLLFGWFVVSLVATLISGNEGIDLSFKLAALATVTLWTLPLFIVPSLGLEIREVKVALLTYALLGVAGGILSCFQSLLDEQFSALVGWKYAYGVADSERRADLPLGVSTVISLFFATVLPIGFAAFVGGERRAIKVFGFVTVLAAGAGTIFTASRAAYVILFLVALGCVFVMRTPRSSKTLPFLGFVALVLLVATALTQLNFERVTTLKDGSFGWRYRAIESSLDMMREAPLLGTGLETHFRRQHGPVKGYFATEKPHDAIYYKNQIAPSDAHNAYLLIGAESGALGLMFFVLFLVSLGGWWYRAQRDCSHADHKLWIRIFLIGIVTAGLHSFFGTDLVRQTRMAPLFWIFCGLGIAYAKAVLEEESSSPA